MSKGKLKFSLRLICLLCAIAMIPVFSSCSKAEESSSTEIVYHTVTFNTGAGTPIASMKIQSGKYAPRPEDPTLENYIFYRWELGGKKFSFTSDPITADTTITASWISAESMFNYDIIEGSDCLTLTGINNTKEFSSLTLPSTLNGKTVTAISDSAFEKESSSLYKNMIVPASITSLGASAFADCSELPITVEGVITKLGEATFSNCGLLSKIKLGGEMTSIPYMSFEGCSSLSTVTIPSMVEVIEENAFASCSALSSIVIPASLKTVEDSAFDECEALKAIFYMGSDEGFEEIQISAGNDAFDSAAVYFYSEDKPESTDGDIQYWYYDQNGSPRVW